MTSSTTTSACSSSTRRTHRLALTRSATAAPDSISPTVVVTAGHCTTGVDSGRIYLQQSAAPNYDPNAFGGRGGDPTTGYPYEGGITFHRADNYGFLAGFPETKDAGVVVLDQAVTPANGFGILPAAGAIDRYIAAAGDKKQARFTVSGYGLSDQDPRPVSFRKRLMANSYAINNRRRSPI